MGIENKGTEKGCVEKQKIEASLYTLSWGFKKIQFTLYTYVLANKMVQNLYKS